MSELADFLLARLAEREVLALAANTEEARRPYGDRHIEPVPEEGWGALAENYLGGEWGAYVASLNPRQVLAEVAALRGVIETHRQIECVNCTDAGRGVGTYCFTCGHDDEMGLTARYDGTCSTLRALAGAWPHHPDFNPAWRTS